MRSSAELTAPSPAGHDCPVTDKNSSADRLRRPWLAPLLVFVAGLAVYGSFSAERLLSHSRDNHYVYLADCFLDGRLFLEGKPPHRNDWARHDGRWFVSFPPFPAVLMMPGVAIRGLEFNDRLFTLPLAAAGPALLLILLQMLAARGRISRKAGGRLLLTALYGVGTIYFFCAVQGSVWYTAHIVGGVMLLLYLILSLDARHPLLAGLCLGLAFASRPPMILAAPLFLHELLRSCRTDPEAPLTKRAGLLLGQLDKSVAARRLALFSLPLLAAIGAVLWLSWARCGDPLEPGHGFLRVIQTPRIEKWGLISYHYLGRNLSALLSSLPWLTAEAPHVKISLHGLALWLTTPLFLWALWPRRLTRDYAAVAVTLLLVALPSLLYQNTGWVQFGQRFSLDYTPFLILLLAMGERRFGKLWIACLIWSMAINAFGAATFDRCRQFYAHGEHRHEIHQPD
jgi:hypothetical protein